MTHRLEPIRHFFSKVNFEVFIIFRLFPREDPTFPVVFQPVSPRNLVQWLFPIYRKQFRLITRCDKYLSGNSWTSSKRGDWLVCLVRRCPVFFCQIRPPDRSILILYHILALSHVFLISISFTFLSSSKWNGLCDFFVQCKVKVYPSSISRLSSYPIVSGCVSSNRSLHSISRKPFVSSRSTRETRLSSIESIFLRIPIYPVKNISFPESLISQWLLIHGFEHLIFG